MFVPLWTSSFHEEHQRALRWQQRSLTFGLFFNILHLGSFLTFYIWALFLIFCWKIWTKPLQIAFSVRHIALRGWNCSVQEKQNCFNPENKNLSQFVPQTGSLLIHTEIKLQLSRCQGCWITWLWGSTEPEVTFPGVFGAVWSCGHSVFTWVTQSFFGPVFGHFGQHFGHFWIILGQYGAIFGPFWPFLVTLVTSYWKERSLCVFITAPGGGGLCGAKEGSAHHSAQVGHRGGVWWHPWVSGDKQSFGDTHGAQPFPRLLPRAAGEAGSAPTPEDLLPRPRCSWRYPMALFFYSRAEIHWNSIPTQVSSPGKRKFGSSGWWQRQGWEITPRMSCQLRHKSHFCKQAFSWNKVSYWAFSLSCLFPHKSPRWFVFIGSGRGEEEGVWRHFPPVWQSWVAFQQRCCCSALREHSKCKEFWRNGEKFLLLCSGLDLPPKNWF